MKILSVVGARPNFMKIGPFISEIVRHNNSIADSRGDGRSCDTGMNGYIEHKLVHTGQHYDDKMSKVFFDSLEIPEPDFNLGIGSGSHAEQVGQTMIAFERLIRDQKPDWVVVVGDVNATLACSVTARKEGVRCCHLEAGLRSGDMSMPEEINRLVTDRISNLLLVPDRISVRNLESEGVPGSVIRFVGNIMIDSLDVNKKKASGIDIRDIIDRNLISGEPASSMVGKLEESMLAGGYALTTIHRPSNVDDRKIFNPLVNFLVEEVAEKLTLLWPVHPRSLKQLKESGFFELITKHPGILLLEPLDYLEMLRLNMDARVMLTDSGGLQEECTVLGTPCLTMRWNTERPVTLRENGGTGILVGNDINMIRKEFNNSLTLPRTPVRPELWDGHTAGRCLKAILEFKQFPDEIL